MTRSRAIGIVVAALFGVGLFAVECYVPHTAFSGERTITVVPASGSRRIAAALRGAGVIRSPWAFITYVSLRGEASMLKPGTYAFRDDATISRIAATLVEGAGQEITVVIPEGWSAKDIGALFAERDIFSATAFLRAVGMPPGTELTDRFSFLNDLPAGAGLEGYLFPDTYRFFRFADPGLVIQRMLGNFDAKLTPDLRDAISASGRTVFEIVTVASLIEKEVRSDADRALVAGILWKRLDIGMPLQVDATITYITGKRSTNVTNGETVIDSPYNTYRYPGLPVGPIANPGLTAIRAAIFPTSSPYLYYLSAADGTTVFSRTLEEHNIAKAKYLR